MRRTTVHTFVNSETSQRMTVLAQPQQSAFMALFETLKRYKQPLNADWTLVATKRESR